MFSTSRPAAERVSSDSATLTNDTPRRSKRTNNVPALGFLPATVITESYTQLKEISDDVDDARVYGGIHFRYDQDAGDVLGRAIATEVVKNNLRPVHP
jgi:hypothetical protein